MEGVSEANGRQRAIIHASTQGVSYINIMRLNIDITNGDYLYAMNRVVVLVFVANLYTY